MSNHNQQIESFFDKQEKRVTDKQKKIVSKAMDNLFKKSPHFNPDEHTAGEIDSIRVKSLGEYDANHKIQINNEVATPHHDSTLSEARSLGIHKKEKTRIKKIECGDKVTIFNDTWHNHEVEFAGPDWKRVGYFPYTLTKTELRSY